jgi:hypothetical protein
MVGFMIPSRHFQLSDSGTQPDLAV